MRKKLFVSVVCLIVILSVPGVSYAVSLGGRWQSNPTYNSSGLVMQAQVNSAIQDWNSALSSVDSSITISYSTAASATLGITENFFGYTGWNAMGTPGPDPYSGTYTYAGISLNRTYMDGFSNTKRRAIIAHEVGHILGLAHYNSSSPRSLMYYAGSSVYFDDWGIYSPQAFDVSELGLIY